MNEATTEPLTSRPSQATPMPAAPVPAAAAAPPALDSAISRATQALLGLQQPDGHWVFELEADATIPAEYVLLQHYLGEDTFRASVKLYLERHAYGCIDGSVQWFNGSDPACPSTTYHAGQSFIEDAFIIHNVKNASSSAAAEMVAIHINPAGTSGPAFRVDEPRPTNCR